MTYLRWTVRGLIGSVLMTAPVYAQSPDPRASDAAQLFRAFCVGTTGMRERAIAVLGNGNEMANRLPDEIVRARQGGHSGGVGWAIRSPANAELMLDFEERGICGVRIREADERSVLDVFEMLLLRIASEVGAELSRRPVETNIVAGVRTTYIAYGLPMGGRTAAIALTTTERPVGEQQHFVTFGFVK